METSVSIKEISKAILEAQKNMGVATKEALNPFFKSKYADLNAIREACLPALNNAGITALQPTVNIEGKNYVQTILLHESGEHISSLTEIIYSKEKDAQAQGSGITYARRYGLQSLMNIGAEDDDGNLASNQSKKTDQSKEIEQAFLTLQLSTTIDELQSNWKLIGSEMQKVTSILQMKETLKIKLTK